MIMHLVIARKEIFLLILIILVYQLKGTNRLVVVLLLACLEVGAHAANVLQEPNVLVMTLCRVF